MKTLKITRLEFDLIKSGQKKIEFRKPSLFNKRVLLDKDEEGKFIAVTTPGKIKFVHGYRPDAPYFIATYEKIIPIKFTQNYSELDGEPIEAREGECIIAIYLT